MANKKKILVKDVLSLLDKDVMINVYVQNGYVQLSVLYKDKYKHQSEMEIYKDYERARRIVWIRESYFVEPLILRRFTSKLC